MKKLLSITLAIIMIFSMLVCGGITSSASNPSGSCGEGVMWEYSQEDKTLTISGRGYMTDYAYDSGSFNRPWEEFKDEIEELVIEDGLASIGNYAFVDCKNLTKFTSRCWTLIVIGQGAFQSCINLKMFFVPSTVIAIGPAAFKGCAKLDIFRLCKDVVYIGNDAFDGCPIDCTLYTGTADQADFIYFEDETEGLVNPVYADTNYDVSVNIGTYQVLDAVSLEPFVFVIKDGDIARDFRSSYKTITENGVEYYYGEMAVMGDSIGETSVLAVGENNEVLGVFSVLVSECSGRHNYTREYEAKAPTCYHNGVTISECENCTYKKSTLTIAPHSFVYETVTEATCVINKVEIGICSVCNKETKRVEYSKGHNWTDWEVVVAPTEEATGEKQRKCTGCEEIEKETIPALSTVIGDANGDGKVSAIDARWVLQYAAGMRELDEHYLKLTDVNNDGKVTAFDARKILQMAAS
ncbi:MAG: leucine-rich repeat protein [Clostridia bacterium]|nr:leucine-rich repeat protein [Clostridia bacterium]